MFVTVYAYIPHFLTPWVFSVHCNIITIREHIVPKHALPGGGIHICV